MLLDIEQQKDRMVFSYFNENGGVDLEYLPLNKNEKIKWSECTSLHSKTDPVYKNWNGKSVYKKKTDWMDKFGIFEYIWRLDPDIKNKLFSDHFPNVHFVDIEVKVTDGFPEPSVAPNEVLTIAIVDPDLNIRIMGLKDLEDEDIKWIEDNTNKHIKANTKDYYKDFNLDFKIIYNKFDSEYSLLSAFFDYICPSISVMTGWNFVDFDWQYLINRAKKIGVDISSASPTGKIRKNGLPAHKGIYDYAEIFNNWDRSIDVKENNTLDFVSESVTGVGKIKFKGDFQKLYEDDFKTYIYYNAVDSILVYLIDIKQKTLQLMLTLANSTKIHSYKATSPVAITHSLLSEGYFKRNRVIAAKYMEPDKEGFAGAYVKEPTPNFYKAVASFDFASLYPSIMRQFNISPETYLGKLKSDNLDEERQKYIDEKIISVTGASYAKELSVLKEIMTTLFNKRKEYKKVYMDAQEEIGNLEKMLKEL